MKTSNKIFISFLIFLFSGIIALYIGSKYYAEEYDTDDFVHQEKLLPAFSVVVAEPGAAFCLNNGKENKITHTYLKGSVPDIGSFAVRNDTLFMSMVKLKKGQVRHTSNVTYVSCVNVKSIVSKENSDIRLDKFEADTLDVSMNKSRLNWEFGNIISLQIQAKDSDIYLYGKKIEKTKIQLDKTQLRIDTKTRINELSGILINNSEGFFSHSAKIHLDTDRTSSYNFYDFVN